LKNRIVFGAHTTNMAENGLPGPRHLAYYLERAKGGAAMIVVEPVPVHASAVLTRGNFKYGDDVLIAPMSELVKACQAHGTVMIQQLYHVGQHGDFDNSFHVAWSPSGLPSYHDSDGSHAMSENEIEEVIAGFVDAAIRAQACGFDGIELFGAYNGLIEQFWLPWSNRRQDAWGGSLDNRMRFVSDIMTRTRAAVGESFIIGLNASIDTGVSIALDVPALCEIAAWLDERKLVDYISCGTGGYFNFSELIPTFQYADKLGAPVAEALKAVVRHAKVQCESHIRTPENADDILASGWADTVSIVRGQIADPHWARKALTAHSQDIRPCLSCNQMCWGRRSRDYWISCMVNPSVGREFEWGGDAPTPTSQVRKVLVIGGGPAGLEVARVAAENGHKVTLLEASDKLGGAFRLAGLQPRRAQILDLLAWYERQLSQLGVQVQLNCPVEADDLAAYSPEVLILATGSQPDPLCFQRQTPAVTKLPGSEAANVWSVEDVMGRRARMGHRVVLLDDTGDWRGAGTAWHLAEQGHQVTLVTSMPMVGHWLQRTGSDGKLRQQLAQLGVQWQVESTLSEWGTQGALVTNALTGSTQWMAADSLVTATVNLAETSLYQAVQRHPIAKTTVIHCIGDCLAPRLAVHGIYEARALARTL
jgi:2,4-dienoyl-CoA reductase-like NADH-dependent reductase (Old Yellow Enzyme family)